MDVRAVTVGGLIALTLAGLAWWLIPRPVEEFSAPPKAQECARSWNSPDNAPLREATTTEGYTAAIVHGFVAERLYHYCAVNLLETATQGRWASYIRPVSGLELESPPSWVLDTKGRRFPDWLRDFLVNAEVDETGSVRVDPDVPTIVQPVKPARLP